jgi:hypothetical protein
MTSVYSGGLVYEYSEEGSGYGLVTINGNSISEKSDFRNLMQQFKKNSAIGDGGYKASGSASKCPRRSSTWEVKDFRGAQLPSIPDGALKYMGKGAGKAPGLKGGSQWATGTSTGTADAGSGGASATGSAAAGEGAGVSLHRGDMTLMPLLACVATVFLSTFLGAALL